MEPSRIPLIQSPTPLHRLPQMSEELGLDLWIKRDDLTGFALGGNKGRKLEYLMAEAVAQKAEVVVSCGSLQSNFIRQLGAACSVLGMQCAAAVMAVPYEGDLGVPPAPHLSVGSGNVTINRMLGVDLRVYPDGTWEELFALADDLAAEFQAAGKRVYHVPIGGSSALGAYSFYKAGLELQAQANLFDWTVFASSSGSTHVGLEYAYHGTSTRILGIACDPEPEITQDFAALSSSLDELAGLGQACPAEAFSLNLNYVGPGYGVPSEPGNAAIEHLARREGIFLDPIYSGKAFAGLMDLAKRGEISGRVCFWHTGGIPTLFAMP